MRKLTRAEAKRFAHKLVGDLITRYRDSNPRLLASSDGQLLTDALFELEEQHHRFGPKSTDRTPAGAVLHATPLLDVIQNNEVA